MYLLILETIRFEVVSLPTQNDDFKLNTALNDLSIVGRQVYSIATQTDAIYSHDWVEL